MMKKLSASVGKAGTNKPTDVLMIQGLLNHQHLDDPSLPLLEDGKSGPNTIHCIESFQRQILHRREPNGFVEVNGDTFKQLIEHEEQTHTSPCFGPKGLALLKAIETLATCPYDDQTGNTTHSWVKGATIGYGHLIRQADWTTYCDGLNETESVALLENDLRPFVDSVANHVKVEVSQNEFDAMVILAFNIGRTAFLNSSVLKMVNDPCTTCAYPTLEEAWKAWHKSQGKTNKGLQNRRHAEWLIYSKGIYETW